MTKRALIAVAAVLLLCAGCRSGSSTSSGEGGAGPDEITSVPSPTPRQHLVTAITSDPITFNPILGADQSSATAVGNLFDTLVRLDPKTTKVEPALAERWEVSEDGKECVFHLRPGVRWHDGRTLTAEDVLFTFRAIYDRRVPSALKHVLSVDGEPFEIEKIADRAVRIRVSKPFAPMLSSLAMVPIIPEHELGSSLAAGSFAQQWGLDTPPDGLVGTGPYRMVEFEPGDHLSYRRNPDYWMHDGDGSRLPYLEERTIRIVADRDAIYDEFLAGEIDILNLSPAEVSELRAREPDLGIRVREVGIETGTLFVTFNRNPRHYRKDRKTDPRLRWFTDGYFLRAVAHAIDRDTIVSRWMQGAGEPAVAFISPANAFFHHDGLTPYEYDLEKARGILHEGGYADRDEDGLIEDSDGNVVEFTLHTNAGNRLRENICATLVEDWGRLGMKVEVEPLDSTALVDRLERTFDWDAVLIGFTGVLDPHNSTGLLRSAGSLHLWNPKQQRPGTKWEAEIDRLVEQGAAELDPQARRDVYLKIQEILHEELPMIETVRGRRIVAYKQTLENFEPTVWGLYRPERIRFSE